MKRLVLLAAVATALASPAMAQAIDRSKPFIYDAPPNGRAAPPIDRFDSPQGDWGYIEVYPDGAKEPSYVAVRNQKTAEVYTKEDLKAVGSPSVQEFIMRLEAKDFAAPRAPKAEPAPPPAEDGALPLEIIPAPEPKQ